jgi:hypothetical protein
LVFAVASLGQVPARKSSGVTKHPVPPPVTLQEAVAKGLVTVSMKGLGGSSGETIRMELRKTPAAGVSPITISIPSGSALRSGSAGEQDMVVGEISQEETPTGAMVSPSRIVLRGTTPVRLILMAFCMEFEKDNPSESTGFRLDSSDRGLACVAEQSRKLSLAARQAAVWIYTDRITFSHMSSKFDVSSAEFSEGAAVAEKCRAAAAQEEPMHQ